MSCLRGKILQDDEGGFLVLFQNRPRYQNSTCEKDWVTTRKSRFVDALRDFGVTSESVMTFVKPSGDIALYAARIDDPKLKKPKP